MREGRGQGGGSSDVCVWENLLLLLWDSRVLWSAQRCVKVGAWLPDPLLDPLPGIAATAARRSPAAGLWQSRQLYISTPTSVHVAFADPVTSFVQEVQVCVVGGHTLCVWLARGFGCVATRVQLHCIRGWGRRCQRGAEGAAPAGAQSGGAQLRLQAGSCA